MKNRIPLQLLLCFVMTACHHNRFVVTDSIEMDIAPKPTNIDNARLYEDSSYVVSRTCSGEFGGTVIFTDKQTGDRYASEASCPVAVNKVNGVYYVTCTRAHMLGRTRVLEIANPKSMAMHVPPKLEDELGRPRRMIIGEDESVSTQGTITLVDSVGVLALASFVYDDKLYHIVAALDHTDVASIRGNRLARVCSLSDESLSTYSPQMIVGDDGHMRVWFSNTKTEGFLDIYGNQISINRRLTPMRK